MSKIINLPSTHREKPLGEYWYVAVDYYTITEEKGRTRTLVKDTPTYIRVLWNVHDLNREVMVVKNSLLSEDYRIVWEHPNSIKLEKEDSIIVVQTHKYIHKTIANREEDLRDLAYLIDVVGWWQ